MNKFLLLIVLFCSMSFTGLAQNPVKDNNKINQLKSMEFMQWKFTPEEYYYSWYKQKVLWWTVKLPGLGIHDKGIGGIGGGDNYVNKYGNNIKQYTPAIASVVLQRQEAKKQEEETKIVYNQELAKFADREVDYAYTLTASRRNELKNEFIQLLMKYASDNSFSNEREKNCKTLVFEYDRILANVKIINESHMSNATKREAYLECEQELVELIALVTRLSNLNNVLKLK